jgi:hypothetical protein
MSTILTMVLAAMVLAQDPADSPADILPMPPASPGGDETVVADSAAFADCDKAVTMLTSQTRSTIAGRTYSRGGPWIKVLRTTVESGSGGARSSFRMICWYDADGHTHLVGDFQKP